MLLHVYLMRVRLRYRDGMVLRTATSGAIPALDELRLVVECDGAITALGASRLNIAYLSGIDPDVLIGLCIRAVQSVDWRREWRDISTSLDADFPDLPAPARMLVEMAAADGAARSAGLPLSCWLGGGFERQVPTNQTLFHADDQTMLRRAESYVSRGFTALKLRIGVDDFADDERRLGLLRHRFGNQVQLSVDANGTWAPDAAEERIARLRSFDLQYIEQPVAATGWSALVRLSATSPVPLMLDESLDSPAAVKRLAECGIAMLGHLKLAKLGGLDRLMHAGRCLRTAGVGFMVGQMNEGVVSTLAAAHAAVALQSEFTELYGADGLASDPAGQLIYANGCLALPPGPGLGLMAHERSGEVLWEQTV